MPAIRRTLAFILVTGALGCSDAGGPAAGERQAPLTPADVKKSILEENQRNDERIKALEQKYGKDHPIVKEERLNNGSTEEK